MPNRAGFANLSDYFFRTMKVKVIWGAAVLLFLGLLVFFVTRFTSLLKPRTDTINLLDTAFQERLEGYFNRRDTSLTPPRLQYLSVRLYTGTSEKQLAAVFKGLNPREGLLLTLLTEEEGTLKNMIEGSFDNALTELCRALPSGIPVYLRWNPDMEVPVKRFPWQYQAPADYIAAFRHMATRCRKERPSLKIIWSPAGYPGTEEYWPGGDVVDVVSISMNGQSERESTAYPPEPDRRGALRRKILRTRFMDKPVFLLTPSADSTYNWRKDLAAVARQLRTDSALIFQSTARNKAASRTAGTLPVLGVYDPNLGLTGSEAVKTEHLFIDLGTIQSGKFAREFEAVVRRGHQAIVTVEPWRDSKIRKDSSVLQNTEDGVYDEEFREFFRIVAAARQPVYVRFAHEMEIPIHRYSWQSKDPVLYIKAFRHFMQLGKDVKQVRKIWGPAGDRGSMEWYPGDDVVDFVSIAIYGLPDKNITDPAKQESLETIFNRKAWRMKLAAKPIFITEFGVKGPDDFQATWMENAARVIARHPEVVGACYFNLADNPGVWGNMPAPDWAISRQTFDRFVQVLREN